MLMRAFMDFSKGYLLAHWEGKEALITIFDFS
jgi:hypothetical protein